MPYTFCVWLKAAERTWAAIDLGSNNHCFFDLANGLVGNVASGSTATIETAQNGWWKCRVTTTLAAGTSYASIITATGNGTHVFTGTANSGIHAWGAQLERSASARAYIKTTTSAVYGPRFDHDPLTGACRGLLVEEQRINCLGYSENLTVWNLTGVLAFGSGSVADAAIAPDGHQTADQIVEDTGNGEHQARLTSATFTAGSVVTCSCFLKAAGRTKANLKCGWNSDGVSVDVDLTAGTIGAATLAGAWTNGAATITRHANDWWRVFVTATAVGASQATLHARIRDAAGALSYAGENTGGLYVGAARSRSAPSPLPTSPPPDRPPSPATPTCARSPGRLPLLLSGPAREPVETVGRLRLHRLGQERHGHHPRKPTARPGRPDNGRQNDRDRLQRHPPCRTG